MAAILLAYATTEGQTGRIAERIASVLADAGHESTTWNLAETDPGAIDLTDFDAVLLGASIHAGTQQAVVRDFAGARADVLETMPTGYFQVSLSSATDEGEAEAAGYVATFVDDTGWEPDRIGLFGGALRYDEMGFLKRTLIRQVVKRSMADLPADADGEFTDWDEVETFAVDFGTFVAAAEGGPVASADENA